MNLIQPPGIQEPAALTLLLREHREVEAHLEASRGYAARLEAEGAHAMGGLAAELRSFGKVIQEDLSRHIAHEDRALFPVLARYIGDQSGPIAVMLMEHRHLEQEEARYRAGVQDQDADALVQAIRAIYQVLTAHIWKEEHVLFPLACNTLQPADWQEVLERIRDQG